MFQILKKMLEKMQFLKKMLENVTNSEKMLENVSPRVRQRSLGAGPPSPGPEGPLAHHARPVRGESRSCLKKKLENITNSTKMLENVSNS